MHFNLRGKERWLKKEKYRDIETKKSTIEIKECEKRRKDRIIKIPSLKEIGPYQGSYFCLTCWRRQKWGVDFVTRERCWQMQGRNMIESTDAAIKWPTSLVQRQKKHGKSPNNPKLRAFGMHNLMHFPRYLTSRQWQALNATLALFWVAVLDGKRELIKSDNTSFCFSRLGVKRSPWSRRKLRKKRRVSDWGHPQHWEDNLSGSKFRYT